MKTLTQSFFDNWVESTKRNEKFIIQNWNYESELSSIIMYGDNSVVVDIARQMGLQHYFEYYKIDTIFFKDSDKVAVAPQGQTWVSTIQIAFEHENYINSGLFQEVSHLMITDCNLAVLVTYPNNDTEIEREIKGLHKLISSSLQGKTTIQNKNFLLIFGWNLIDKIEWVGCQYKEDDWHILNADCEVFKLSDGLRKSSFSIK